MQQWGEPFMMMLAMIWVFRTSPTAQCDPYNKQYLTVHTRANSTISEFARLFPHLAQPPATLSYAPTSPPDSHAPAPHLNPQGFHRSGLSSHLSWSCNSNECLPPTSRSDTQHTRMNFQHLRTMSSLSGLCFRGVSQAGLGPLMPHQSEPQHGLSLATLSGYDARPGLLGTFQCLSTDRRTTQPHEGINSAFCAGLQDQTCLNPVMFVLFWRRFAPARCASFTFL